MRLLRNKSFLLGWLVLLPFLIFVAMPSLIAPHPPNDTLAAPFENPSFTHLLGTDEVGRDLFSRIVWAARHDLGVSMASTGIAVVVGTGIGLFIGFVGGIRDSFVMRVTDVMLAFPSILLALFVITVFGRGTGILILALALLFVSSYIRLARGLGLSLRDRGYIEASEISGGRHWHVVWWHLLPNASGPLIVGAAGTAAFALIAAATLSYLGLGTAPPDPSWGSMLQTAFAFLFESPLYGIVPGGCITLVAFGFIWISDGIEETLAVSASDYDVRGFGLPRLGRQRAVEGRPPTI